MGGNPIPDMRVAEPHLGMPVGNPQDRWRPVAQNFSALQAQQHEQLREQQHQRAKRFTNVSFIFSYQTTKLPLKPELTDI